MPKLVIKQDLVEISSTQKYAKWVSIGGLLLLLAVVAFFLSLSFLRPTPAPAGFPASLPLPSMQSSSNTEGKAALIQQNDELEAMSARFQALAGQVPGSQVQASALLAEAEGILQQLFIMDDSVLALGLDDNELQAMQTRQQYLQDVWQSRLHFSELRLGRMQDNVAAVNVMAEQPVVSVQEVVPGTEVVSAPAEPVAALPESVGGEKKGSRFLAAPPPDMELPAGFCNLTGPDACKPEPEN